MHAISRCGKSEGNCLLLLSDDIGLPDEQLVRIADVVE